MPQFTFACFCGLHGFCKMKRKKEEIHRERETAVDSTVTRGHAALSMVDVQCLSNYDLQIHLEQLGFSPGPILPSTRKLYEKKLKQLLVLPPYGQLVVKDLRKLDGFQDDTEEFNIILKGNITFTTEKDKESKKRLEACFGKTRVVDLRCLAQMPTNQIRSATPPPDTIPKRDLCAVAKSVEDQLPLGLGLAVLGVLIIVVFVYITVENRPLLA